MSVLQQNQLSSPVFQGNTNDQNSTDSTPLKNELDINLKLGTQSSFMNRFQHHSSAQSLETIDRGQNLPIFDQKHGSTLDEKKDSILTYSVSKKQLEAQYQPAGSQIVLPSLSSNSQKVTPRGGPILPRFAGDNPYEPRNFPRLNHVQSVRMAAAPNSMMMNVVVSRKNSLYQHQMGSTALSTSRKRSQHAANLYSNSRHTKIAATLQSSRKPTSKGRDLSRGSSEGAEKTKNHLTEKLLNKNYPDAPAHNHSLSLLQDASRRQESLQD